MEALDWHLGDVVRKLRERRRWNQQQLAKTAHVNKATIVRVEEGGNNKRETLEAVARALDVTIADLFRLVPGEAPQRTDPAAERFRDRPAGERRTGPDRRSDSNSSG